MKNKRGIPQGGGAGRHDRRHQRVGFRKRRVVQVQPVDGDSVQGRVVQDDHAISIEGEAFQGQDGVVWLNDSVRGVDLIGEHRVSLHEFFRETVTEALEKKRTQAGARATSDRMAQNKPLYMQNVRE